MMYVHIPYICPPNIWDISQFSGHSCCGIHLAISFEVNDVVGCILVHLLKTVVFIYPCSMLVVNYIYIVAAILFSKMSNMCTVLLVTWLMPLTSYVAYIYISFIYGHQILPHNIAYMYCWVGLFIFGSNV